VALLGNGRITHLPGGIDEYLRRRTAETAVSPPSRPARTGPSDAAQQRTARKEATRLERRMDALAQREEELHAAAADAAEAGDVARLAELEAALRAVSEDREVVELEWLAAAELAEG
jgi:ATP-binding cassette subfamily F protein uup